MTSDGCEVEYITCGEARGPEPDFLDDHFLKRLECNGAVIEWLEGIARLCL